MCNARLKELDEMEHYGQDIDLNELMKITTDEKKEGIEAVIEKADQIFHTDSIF